MEEWGKTGERPGNGKIMKVINLVGKDRGKTNEKYEVINITKV